MNNKRTKASHQIWPTNFMWMDGKKNVMLGFMLQKSRYYSILLGLDIMEGHITPI